MANKTDTVVKNPVRSVYRNLLYGAARTHQLRGRAKPYRRLVLRPDFQSPSELADVARRLAWYIPPGVQIPIVARGAFPFNFDDAKGSPADADHAGNHRWRAIEMLTSKEALPSGNGSLILRWRNGASAAPQLIKQRGALRIVDPWFLSTSESNTYLRLLFRDLWTPGQRESYAIWSANQLQLMYENLAGRTSSYVFGTGPSLAEALDLDLHDGLRIACNSIVRSHAMMESLRPDILVFMDPVFHFGVSRYANDFRADMIEAHRRYSPWLVVPLEYAPVLEAHHPSLRKKLVPIDLRRSRRFNVPTPDAPWSRATANVLTGAMLPLAAGLTQRIHIAGCDGRERQDTGFWKHNDDAQYGDEYDTVRRDHPSFFSDRDYVGYYSKHCRTLANLLHWCEQEAGAEFLPITHSVIPALRERGAP